MSRVEFGKQYKGVIHFHSRFSHDGHDSLSAVSAGLKAEGIDFCVITDHFEDFDAGSFQEYLSEMEAVNSLQQTVLIPAVEAEFKGFHVIFLPVVSYEAVEKIVKSGILPGEDTIKILAHPTRHPVAEVAEFLRTRRLDGVELWNQQADGNYLPPADYFRSLMETASAVLPAVYFGNDIHNIQHRINNLLLIANEGDLSPGMIVSKMRQREFFNYNRNVDDGLPGNSGSEAIHAWFARLDEGNGLKSVARKVAKKYLKIMYHLLPRSAQVTVNDFKNAVKNRL